MGRRKQTANGRKYMTGEKDKGQRKAVQASKPQAAVGQVGDANSRKIFKDASLCAQFLKDNLDIPALKDVKPEDIVDVTEKYQAYLGIQFEADTVKRIRLHVGETAELFLVSLIEHKSRVDYNISMQLLRYMICIWTEYAREMEAVQEGISRTKAFRYPPILPIVYYEGAENWTADLHLKDRIHLKEIFGEYVPDFTYKLVRIHDYTNEQLLGRKNEMSFLMMVNRIQTTEDLEEFLRVEQDRVKGIVDRASPQVLEIIAETIWSLCMKMNVPVSEAKECVRKVKERNMGYLFENMEKMDIQEERRKTTQARREAEEVKSRLEEAEKRLEEVKSQAEKAENRAEEAEKRLEEVRGQAEKAKSRTESQLEKAYDQIKETRSEAMRNIVLLCQRLGVSKEKVVKELMAAYGIDQNAAREEVERYWGSQC